MAQIVVASSILVIGALLWLKVNPELTIAEELGLKTIDNEEKATLSS
ncbi:MAG: hypothetical protein H6Q68_400 [Firmicutes bacterium]|nr:hypothetical protein [Bacillota bacterium]